MINTHNADVVISKLNEVNLQLRAGKPPKSNPDQFMHFFKEKTLNKDNALKTKKIQSDIHKPVLLKVSAKKMAHTI